MSVSVRLRPCPCLYVRIRESAFVCVHIIKRPDASGCIDNDASGRVFRSRTFDMHYMYISYKCAMYLQVEEKCLTCGMTKPVEDLPQHMWLCVQGRAPWFRDTVIL